MQAFTGLRTVAAFLVIFAHVNFWTGYRKDQPFFYLCITRLEFTVPVFFALSGYLLYRSWKKDIGNPIREKLWTYCVHRWWRIVPAYLIILLLVWLTSPWFISTGGLRPSWHDFTHYLWFGQNYWPHEQVHGLTHTWSSAIESTWYCIFPIIAIILIFLRTHIAKETEITAAIIVTFIGVGLFSLQIWLSKYPIFADYRLVPWGFLSWFTIGIVINILSDTPKWLTITIATIVLVSFFIAPLDFFGPATTVDYHLGPAVRKYILYTVIAGGVIYLTRAGALSFLRWPLVVWLGELTYEIFLLHVPVMELVMGILHWQTFTGNPYVLYSIVLSIAIFIAWPLHQVCLQMPVWWDMLQQSLIQRSRIIQRRITIKFLSRENKVYDRNGISNDNSVKLT